MRDPTNQRIVELLQTDGKMTTRGNDEFFTLLLFVNALIIVISATVLLVSLPTRVKLALKRGRKFMDCYIGLLVVVTLVTMPTNVVICFVHFELIPWPMAARALQTALAAESDEQMYNGLANKQDEHRDYVVARGGSAESAEEIQHALWENWPLIVLSVISLTLLSIWMLGKFYTQLVLHLLKQATQPKFSAAGR
jgi:hypothetical protein